MNENEFMERMMTDNEWGRERRYAQEQEQYAKLAQEIANKIAQSLYYGNGRIVETVTKTTEVRTVVYTFPELDLD